MVWERGIDDEVFSTYLACFWGLLRWWGALYESKNNVFVLLILREKSPAVLLEEPLVNRTDIYLHVVRNSTRRQESKSSIRIRSFSDT